MSNVEAIKKALEKVYIGEWYISGVKTNGLSVVHNASDNSMFGITAETFEAQYVAAVNPVAISELLTDLEALQRENVQLRTDASNHAADAETVRREREIERERAEAAEAEVKRLRAAITPSLHKVVEAAQHQYRIEPVDSTAIASAGEHHADK